MVGCAGTDRHAFTYCSAGLLAVACCVSMVEGVCLLSFHWMALYQFGIQ
jgi:hypothetical protein